MPTLETFGTAFAICMIWIGTISLGFIIVEIVRGIKRKIIAPHDEAVHGPFDYRRFEQ